MQLSDSGLRVINHLKNYKAADEEKYNDAFLRGFVNGAFVYDVINFDECVEIQKRIKEGVI